jgi:hypothetical protein
VKKSGGIALESVSYALALDEGLQSWACLTRVERTKRRVREAVKLRAIAWYWEKCAVELSHAPDGAGRKRDRDAFESDFGEAS